MTESTFLSELGIGDPKLVGYVADLLVRFVPSADIWKLRDATGERITHVAAMIAEAESSADHERRRDCHKHVGDFTLFWTGVYPEALAKRLASNSADRLINLQAQGKRSYYLASTLTPDESEVLRRLSVEFELCAYGLSLVRQEWERFGSEGHPPRNPRVIVT